MENVNKNELTKELIEKAMNCKTAEELIELARGGGIELTKEESEAYMAEIEDFELDKETLKQVAGGRHCASNNRCESATVCTSKYMNYLNY